MTLITKNNSIHANYNGEVMDIYALEGSDGNRQIFYTQLTNDDIKNMIAGPSKEQRLEQRLTSDFKCDYNFEKPSKKHINQYPKTLLNSFKMAEMVTPPTSLSKHTPSKHTPSKHTLSKHTPGKHTPGKHTLSKHTLSKHTLSKHTPSKHTLSKHTPGKHTPGKHTLSKHTLSKHTLSKHTPGKQTRRKKRRKRRKRRKTNSISRRKDSQNNTKRVKYAPFSKARKTKRKYYLTPSSNDKMIELEKEDDRPSIERTVY